MIAASGKCHISCGRREGVQGKALKMRRKPARNEKIESTSPVSLEDIKKGWKPQRFPAFS
jgi:hypothetical protein